MAHPRRPDRARDRRHGAADRLRRQRPARDHARRRGARPTSSGTASGPGRAPSIFTTNDTTDRGGRRRSRAAGVEIVADRRRAPRASSVRRHRAATTTAAWPSVDDRARPAAAARPSRRTCCSCPAAGTRTSPCGARPAARSASTSGSPRSSRTGPVRTARIEAVGAAAGDDRGPRRDRARLGRPAAGDDPRRVDAWATHFVDLQRDATVADLRRALGAGLTLDRARQALHDDRHRHRPGQDRRASSRRAIAAALLGQEVGAVGVPTFRPPLVPVSFAPARRPRPRRPRSTRSGSRRSTPGTSRTARSSRTSASGSGRATSRATARSMDDGRPARVRRRADRRRGDGRHDARQDRRPGPGRRRSSSTASTRTRSRRSRSGRAATALMCRPDGMVFDDGVTIAARRRPVPHDDDDRQRRRRPRPPRGVAPDRVAGAARPAHVGHRAVGDGRRRRAARRATSSRALAPDLDVADEAFPFMTWRDAVIAGIAGARLPHHLLRASSRTRSTSRRWHGLALWEAVMAAGAAARDHAVRHRDDARPARREGLPDHRPGDRRHGDARRTSAWLGGLDEEGLHRPALAPPAGHAAGRTASSSSGCCRSTPTRSLPEGAQLVAPDADLASRPGPDARPRHLDVSQRRARPDVRAGARQGRPRADRRAGAGAAAGRPRRRGDDRRLRAVRPGEPAARRRARGRRDGTTPTCAIREMGPLPQVSLRADPRDAGLLARIGEALTAAPPTAPNTVTAATDGEGHVLWLGPDEWLVVAPEGAPADVAAGDRGRRPRRRRRRVPDDRRRLREPRRHRDRRPGRRRPPRVRLRAGPRARRCRSARCAQTLLARANVVLWHVADDPEPALPRPRPALVRALPFGLASGRARGVTRKGRT